MPFLPSPGQVVGAIGAGMQAAENFVTGGLNAAVDGLQEYVEEPTAAATGVTSPNSPGSPPVTLEGVVGKADFDEFCRKVGAAFQAVREDIASIRAYGADGESGSLYQSSGGGMDPLLLILALGGTSGTSSLTDNPLLLMLMMQQGGGGADFLPYALALGLI